MALKKPSPFAVRLRFLREQAGLSIPDLALRSGLPRQAIHRLENGDNGPTWPTVVKLAEALGVQTDAFKS